MHVQQGLLLQLVRYFVAEIDQMRAESAPESARFPHLSAFTSPAASDDCVQMDVTLLRHRKDQSTEARGSKTSELRKREVVLNFDTFLKSTSTVAHSWAVATEDPVVNYVSWTPTGRVIR